MLKQTFFGCFTDFIVYAQCLSGRKDSSGWSGCWGRDDQPVLAQLALTRDWVRGLTPGPGLSPPITQSQSGRTTIRSAPTQPSLIRRHPPAPELIHFHQNSIQYLMTNRYLFCREVINFKYSYTIIYVF